ncbi:MAG: flavodoxin family protein [Saprospiraceae bacterium]|nr:flavodoxin family protein [Candidatus Vicinibacter affinis]
MLHTTRNVHSRTVAKKHTEKELMKKYLILYYSKTNNSKFIAERLSKELNCEMEMIESMIHNLGLLFFISLLNIPIPINVSKEKIKQYEAIIIVGPIWGGLLIAPLKSVIKKCIGLNKPFHFALTCESKESDKDSKYGYNTVLVKAKALGGNLIKSTSAFSTSLISGYHEKEFNIHVKAKFNEDNFSEELNNRVNIFVSKIKNSDISNK